MAEKYQIIGECEVNEKGGIVKIDGGLFRQGYVKDVHISFEGAEDTDGYRFGAAPGQIREEKKEKQMAEKIIIGECEVDGKGRIVKLNRGWFRQGYVYKNYEAYYKDKSAVCYVPEFPDTAYTGQDFLDMCNGQPEIADRVFEAVDWQHPSTYLDEQGDDEL